MIFARATASTEEQERGAKTYRDYEKDQKGDEEVDDGLADFDIVVAGEEPVQVLRHGGQIFVVLSAIELDLR